MTTIEITDNQGTVLETINGDQQFRVEVELDSSAAHPNTIEVEFSWDDGDETDKMTLRHVKGGLYRSNVITANKGGEGGGRISGLGLEIATGGVDPMSIDNGEFLTVTYDDHSTRVRSFKTYVQQGIFINRMFISQVRSYYTTLAMNLTKVIGAFEKIGEDKLNDEGKRLLGLAREGLQIAQTGIEVTGRAIYYLNNDARMLDTQRFHISSWYVNRLKGDFDPEVTKNPNYTHSLRNYDRRGDLGVSEGEDDAVRRASERGRQHAEDVMWRQLGQATLAAYRLLVNATGAAQVMTLFGTNEMGKKAQGWERLVAFFDLMSQAAMMGAMMRFKVTHTTGTTQPRLNRGTAAADPETASIGTRIDPTDAGITNSAAAQAQLVARKHGVHILTRQSGKGVAELRAQGYSPKPMDIKSKTINELDVHLGAPESGLRQVGHFEPQMPAQRPAGMDDATWAKLGSRYEQRKAEFHGPTGQKIEKLIASGKVEVRGGVVYDTGLVQSSGKPITGDYDLFEIVYPDGTPVPTHVYNAVVADLTAGPFQAMHGAHMRWQIDMGDWTTFGEFMHAADVVDTNLGIYNKIVRSHHSEPLIVFGGDRPPYALPSETAPPIKLGDINSGTTPGTGYTRVPLVNPTAGLRYSGMTFLDLDEAQQLQRADDDWLRYVAPINQADVIVLDGAAAEPGSSPRARGWLKPAAAGVGLAALVGLGGFFLFQGDGDSLASTSPTAQPTDGSGSGGAALDTGTATSEPTPAPTPTAEPPSAAALSGDLGAIGAADTLGMQFLGGYSDVLPTDQVQNFGSVVWPLSNDSILHSNGSLVGTPDSWARFTHFGAATTSQLVGPPDVIFGSGGPLACGSTRWNGATVRCPFGESVPTTSDVTIFRYHASEDFPTGPNGHYTQIGLPLITVPPTGEYGNSTYASDFFIPASAWLSLDIDPSGTMSGQATLVGGVPDANTFNPFSPTGVRVVIGGPAIDIIVPREGELAEIDQFRGTLFKHTGDYGQSGGPWHGDLTSPVAGGMEAMPPDLVFDTGRRWWADPHAFADQLSAAFAADDVEGLLGLLDPGVFDVYTEDQCHMAISTGIERSGPLTVLDVRGPVPWQWDTATGPVPFDLSLEVLVEREIDGAPTQAWSHFPIDPADGSLGWVTFCDQ